MALNLATTAPTTYGTLSAYTTTFARDSLSDGRSVTYTVTGHGGTGSDGKPHTNDVPKMMQFRRPADPKRPSGYNAISGRYSVVPRNVFSILGKFGVYVATNQVETMPMKLDIPVPAGALQFNEAHVAQNIIAFLAACYDQREEIALAVSTGSM